MRFRLLGVLVALLVAIPISERPHRISDGVLRIAVIGDSVARGAGDETGRGISGWLDRELASRHINFVRTLNFGINGARTRDVLDLLKTQTARQLLAVVDATIVSIGGNDLYGDSFARTLTTLCADCAIDRVLARVQRVVDRIHHVNPDTRVILLGLYDPYRRNFLDRQVNLWDSRLIARFANDSLVDVVRIADIFRRGDRLSSLDHFHPSASGYELIAARLVAAID